MSNNWIVENLENALNTWNNKLAEIWRLLSESPQSFKGGGIWTVVVNINGALQAIGYALLVLFFLVGIMKQFNSFQELKRPEQALKLFIRFVLAKAAVTWGLDLMMAMFTIAQGVMGKIMEASGISGQSGAVLPQSMIDTIESCGFFESIPLWAVTLIGSLIVTVLAFIMILSVYGRFFSAVYLCRTFSGSAFGIRGGGNQPHRKILSPVLCCRMSGGSGHHSLLYHLFAVRIVPAIGQRERVSSHTGMDISR